MSGHPTDPHVNCPPCDDGDHATIEDGTCTCCGEPLKCLDAGPDPSTCDGPVEYRYALSGTGRSFPRCDKHWHERCVKQDEINARYPYHQPADFDPSYAGERWDDDY